MIEENRMLHHLNTEGAGGSIGVTLPKYWAKNRKGSTYTLFMEDDVVLMVPKEKADKYREKFEVLMGR